MVQFLCFFILVSIHPGFAQSDYLEHNIENERQLDFPGIKVNLTDKNRPELYVSDKNFVFEEKAKLRPGAQVKISTYIISKDILTAINIESVGNKTTREEVIEIFDSGDMNKIKKFITQIAERRREPKTQEELHKLNEKIRVEQSGDDPHSTLYFKTGMIEILPTDDKEFGGMKDVRFFIPLEDIDSLDLSAGEAKVQVIKSLTLLGFKNSKLNIGSADDEAIRIIDQVENDLQNICEGDCPIEQNLKLGAFLNNMINAITYDFFNAEDFDFEHLNEEAMLQQVCLMTMLNGLCSSPELSSSIQKVLSHSTMKDYLQSKKEKYPQICQKFIKK